MKKKMFLVFLVAVIGIVFMSVGAYKAQAETTKLTYSIFFPPTHAQAIAAMDFAKEIEKRTDGKVQITAFPGGTLTKAPMVYDGVVKGISDMGNSCFAYTRGRFPVMEVWTSPWGMLPAKWPPGWPMTLQNPSIPRNCRMSRCSMSTPMVQDFFIPKSLCGPWKISKA